MEGEGQEAGNFPPPSRTYARVLTPLKDNCLNSQPVLFACPPFPLPLSRMKLAFQLLLAQYYHTQLIILCVPCGRPAVSCATAANYSWFLQHLSKKMCFTWPGQAMSASPRYKTPVDSPCKAAAVTRQDGLKGSCVIEKKNWPSVDCVFLHPAVQLTMIRAQSLKTRRGACAVPSGSSIVVQLRGPKKLHGLPRSL